MWIRSQDKKTVFDMTGSNIEIGNGFIVLGFGNSFGDGDIYTVLGKYQTEERAIEVLDEICNVYVSLNEYHNGNLYSVGFPKNGVFQMPEV